MRKLKNDVKFMKLEGEEISKEVMEMGFNIENKKKI
jgi:hypothetical protein